MDEQYSIASKAHETYGLSPKDTCDLQSTLDVLTLKESCGISFVGKNGSGKSNAIKWLILNNTLNNPDNAFQFSIVFTGTRFNDDYKFIDNRFIFEGYQENVLKTYLDKLSKYREKHGNCPHNFCVFDDLLGILNKNSGYLLNFISRQRHTNTTIIFSTQYLNVGSATTLREIVRYVIMFNTKTLNSLKGFYTNFGGLFNNYEEFKDHFLKCTKEKYNAMLYDATVEDVNVNYLQIKFPLIDNVTYYLKFSK
jgi:Poxvirus A32 protein